ncbi:general secretion pathway protein C [Bordetella ansorpii]|jgi:general secretion pathway protein C|uniref:General secretion pathway protein C n=2 Tax=Bordetella ansorpii TaxID=288768 RepID=A0A157QKR2_9BORD|nr:general secretion pathway protein C [Bordetella ansorpii]
MSMSVPSLASALGIALTIGALGLWGYRLAAPLPQPAPAVAVVKPADDGQVDGIAQWLAPGPQKVDVKVVGALIAGANSGAVLSVNGSPPRAYAVGESLAQSVVLDRIDVDAVVLDQEGKAVRLPMPVLPVLPERGIVPATAD